MLQKYDHNKMSVLRKALNDYIEIYRLFPGGVTRKCKVLVPSEITNLT